MAIKCKKKFETIKETMTQIDITLSEAILLK